MPDPLTTEQIDFIIDCVRTWMQTRQENGYNTTTVDDVGQSALLRRLLTGKPRLANPPPKSFAHPWYGIMEDGKAVRCNVVRHRHSPTVAIDRDSRWAIVRQDENTLYVRYQGEGPMYRVWQSEPALDEFGWSMEKIEE